MTFREFVDNCNKLLARHPETAGCEVIYSSDDEGNSFHSVQYNLSVWVSESGDFTEIDPRNDKSGNCVCIN